MTNSPGTPQFTLARARAEATTTGAPSSAAALAAAFLFYTVLTVWHTWPLTLHMSDRLPNDAGDPALNAWLLWWNATMRPLSQAWWDGLGFWPTAGTIAFSEHLLGFAWLTNPIIWLGGSPALAYNVAFLASFVMSAFATHLLVWRLTCRHDAGILAGLAFAFAPIRAGHLSHLQVLTTWWMPVALLGLHEFWRTRQRRWLVLFAAAWLLQALSNNYYALFFSVLVAMWLAWFGLSRATLGRFAAVAAASVLAACALVPLAIGYRATHAEHGLRRGLDEAAIFSADLAAFLNAPRTLWIWGWMQTEASGERELFIGVTAVLLLAAASMRRRHARPAASGDAQAVDSSRPWIRRLRRALFGLASMTMLVAVGLWIGGREQLTIGELSVSTRNPHKTMTVGVVLLAGAVALTPRLWARLRRRTVLGFYVTAWIGCLVLSLGPELRLFETKILYRAPYALLYQLVPGFNGVRAPARFAVLAALCLSVAAGLTYATLVARDSCRRGLVFAGLSLALILEGSLSRLPMATLPEPVPQLASAEGVVLELPFSDAFTEAAALYRTSTHRHRIANGYSGYDPLFYRALRDGVLLSDVAALTELMRLTPVTILVDRSRDRDGRWQAMAERAGGRTRSVDARYAVLFCPRLETTPSRPPVVGAPVAITGIATTLQPERAGAAIDGDAATSWRTDGDQAAGDEIVADLGGVRSIGAVEVDQGGWPAEVPRRLEIAVAEQANDWAVVWSGTTAVQTMRAALADPRAVRLSMTFPTARARYVRLRQTAESASPIAWSIGELRVLGAPSGQSPAD